MYRVTGYFENAEMKKVSTMFSELMIDLYSRNSKMTMDVKTQMSSPEQKGERFERHKGSLV